MCPLPCLHLTVASLFGVLRVERDRGLHIGLLLVCGSHTVASNVLPLSPFVYSVCLEWSGVVWRGGGETVNGCCICSLVPGKPILPECVSN